MIVLQHSFAGVNVGQVGGVLLDSVIVLSVGQSTACVQAYESCRCIQQAGRKGTVRCSGTSTALCGTSRRLSHVQVYSHDMP
jgi:hypothetical protein